MIGVLQAKETKTQTRIAYGLDELAASLGVSTAFLRKEDRLGHLKTTKLGARKLVLAKDLEDYLKGEKSEK